MADIQPPQILPDSSEPEEAEEGAEEASELIPKPAAGYINTDPAGLYHCSSCALFLADSERCIGHSTDQIIKPFGSCAHWGLGASALNLEPQNWWTPLDSAYSENEPGFSCARCEYFTGDDCELVDRESEGLDPGQILATSCCSLWENSDSELEEADDYI